MKILTYTGTTTILKRRAHVVVETDHVRIDRPDTMSDDQFYEWANGIMATLDAEAPKGSIAAKKAAEPEEPEEKPKKRGKKRKKAAAKAEEKPPEPEEKPEEELPEAPSSTVQKDLEEEPDPEELEPVDPKNRKAGSKVDGKAPHERADENGELEKDDPDHDPITEGKEAVEESAKATGANYDFDELKRMKKLRDIVGMLYDAGYEDVEEIIGECERVQEDVAILRRMKDLRKRVLRCAEVLAITGDD